MDIKHPVLLLTTLVAILTPTLLPSPALGAAIIDDFSTYADGDLVGQGSADPGFSGTWTGGVSRPGAAATIVDGSLRLVRGEYGAVGALERAFAPNSLFTDDGNTVWASFGLSASMINASDSTLTVTLYNDAAEQTFWQIGARNGQFSLNGAPNVFGSLQTNTEYLIVTRLQRAAGNETYNVWINPTSEQDAPTITSVAENFVDASATGLTRLLISFEDLNYGDPGEVMQVSGIRVGTQFADVVPSGGDPGAVPAPGVLALLVIGLIGTPRRCARA